MRLLVHNWPQKLGALILAVLVWFFVSTDDTSTTQRSLLVPLELEGIEANQTATGVPEFIEVTVSGISNRINALRAENFDALLDLTGASGEFEQVIRVIPPQDIRVLRANPSRVSGIIETQGEKSVPVKVVFQDEPPPDNQPLVNLSSETVAVRGLSSPLTRVEAVFAPVSAKAGSYRVGLYPVDASGRPVEDVRVDPAEMEVAVAETAVLQTKEVEVAVEVPTFESWRVEDLELESTNLRVAGPATRLSELSGITAVLELATDSLRAGQYTVPLRPELPEGVVAMERKSASFRLVPIANE